MYSKGIMWLDDCRIPFVDGIENEFSDTYLKSGFSKIDDGGDIMNISGGKRTGVYVNTQGRFTPNLLVCDDMLNDGKVSKSVKSKRGGVVDSNSGTYSWNNGKTEKVENYMCGVDDKGTNSRYYDLDLWFDKMLEKL